jgi:hypothetical protein
LCHGLDACGEAGADKDKADVMVREQHAFEVGERALQEVLAEHAQQLRRQVTECTTELLG